MAASQERAELTIIFSDQATKGKDWPEVGEGGDNCPIAAFGHCHTVYSKEVSSNKVTQKQKGFFIICLSTLLRHTKNLHN